MMIFMAITEVKTAETASLHSLSGFTQAKYIKKKMKNASFIISMMLSLISSNGLRIQMNIAYPVCAIDKTISKALDDKNAKFTIKITKIALLISSQVV